MRSERSSAALGMFIALSVLVALLIGTIALLEGHVGGRRAAMAWVIGVYLAGGVVFGGIQTHFSLRSWPPVLWEPGDGKKLVRRYLFAFCFWPLGLVVFFVGPLIDALSGCPRPDRRRIR